MPGKPKRVRKLRQGGSERANVVRQELINAENNFAQARTLTSLDKLIGYVRRWQHETPNMVLKKFWGEKLSQLLSEQKSAETLGKSGVVEKLRASKSSQGKRKEAEKPADRKSLRAAVAKLLQDKRPEEAFQMLYDARDFKWLYGLIVPLPRVFYGLGPEKAAEWLMRTAGGFLTARDSSGERSLPKGKRINEQRARDCLHNAAQKFREIGSPEAIETAKRIEERIRHLGTGKYPSSIFVEGVQDIERDGIPFTPLSAVKLSTDLSRWQQLIRDDRFEDGLVDLCRIGSLTGSGHNELYNELTTNEKLRSALGPEKLSKWFAKASKLFAYASDKANEPESPKHLRTNEKRAIECLERAVELLWQIKPRTKEITTSIMKLNRQIHNIEQRP